MSEHTPTIEDLKVAWRFFAASAGKPLADDTEAERTLSAIGKSAAAVGFAHGVQRTLEVTKQNTAPGDGLLTVIGNPYQSAPADQPMRALLSERCTVCADKIDYVSGIDGQGCYPHCWSCWYKEHPDEKQANGAQLPHIKRITLAKRNGENSAEHWDANGVQIAVSEDSQNLIISPLEGGN